MTKKQSNVTLAVVLTAASVLPAVISSLPGSAPPVTAPSETSTPHGQMRAFFGNLHAHTSYSDGSGTPAQAFARARDVGKLDFMAVTEHNHDAAENGIGADDPRKDGLMIGKQPALYNGSDAASLVSAARAATHDGQFVAIAAQEFSTISSGNHVNVFAVQDVIDVPNGQFNTLYDTWLPQHPDVLNEAPVVQFNHPDFKSDQNPKTKETQRMNDYGLDDFQGDFNKLVGHAERFVNLIEIVSGPALTDDTNVRIGSQNRHEKDFWFYLSKGFHVAPTANQDNHFFTWGTITRARTAVLADRLTTADILRALKARRVYATEDENLQISFQINGREMGSIIHSNSPLDLSITVTVSDPDEPNAKYNVELYRGEIGGSMIEDSTTESSTEGDSSISFSEERYTSGRVFYFIKISQAGTGGEDLAWTAPIWIEPGTEPVPTPTPAATPSPGSTAAAGGFVSSRNSDVFHFANCLDVARIRPENRIFTATEPEDKRLHVGCPRTK